MITLILPGFSPHNRQWADDVAKHLRAKNKDALPHYWEHWSTGKNYSLVKEIAAILEEIDNKKINIIAKSVGVMTALFLILKIPERTGKVILCGIASVAKEERKDLLREALGHVSVKNILCIQNEKDKFVPFADAETFYHSVDPKLKVISKPRSDHHYPFFEDFLEFLA